MLHTARKRPPVIVILSSLGRQCEKDHVYTWMLHYYIGGDFSWPKKVQHLIHTQMR